MKTEVRIVAGTLRGRKLACRVNPDLRPTPQMVREAFFSILGNAIPKRLFIDVFAGTGVFGIEALSRGAKATYFIERDAGLAAAIVDHVRKFGVDSRTKMFRTDSYRWAMSFRGPTEPVNIFLSPPFPDLHERPQTLLDALRHLQAQVAPDSLIVIQIEDES
ncbi:MAG TPA: RsmD family RNA methyltransferase, partial [Gemmataceae bacterium]|nr:RsmD family RNA methyltransferase [Gemmataceae bacterium]